MVTITDVTGTAVSFPIRSEVAGSSYAKETRATVVVTVETDSGTTGRTFSGDFGDVGEEKMGTVLEFVEEKLRPTVVGEPLLSPEALWEEMFSGSKKYMSFQAEDRFLYVHAIGAVDTAIWDAIGTELGVPLYRLWGGYRDSLPIISTGGYYEPGKTHADLVEEAERLRAEGFCGIKMKVGGKSVDEDVERVRAMREGVGEEFVVGCDANQGYEVEQAVEFADRVTEYDVRWLEEPVAWYDQYQGMREVRRQTGIPVTAGQSELSATGCLRLIESDAVDVINYDASWGGGPTVWRKIAGMADVHNVQIGHHEETHLAMHLLGSVPNALFLEGFHPDLDPVFHDMLCDPPTIEDGRLHLPEEPGLGIELDREFVDEHRVET